MGNSGNSARALILLMLIMLPMIQIDFVQSDTVECPTSPSPPECAKDCNGDIWFFHQGKGSCQQCPKCGPGQGLDSHCGGQIGQHAKCEPCIPGETFTDMNWCRPCRLCDNTISDSPCNITTDAVCGKCRPGYYHEKDMPDQCHPCWFLLQPELEPQCQIPQKLTTDPPQEGSEESSLTDAMLQPTLPDENTTPPQETNYVSPSPMSGDLGDNGLSSTILSLEEERGESYGSGDLAEDEQVVDAAVPSNLGHGLLYAILGICTLILISFMATIMYLCWRRLNPHGATNQHYPQTDYAQVNAEDLEDVLAVDVNAQTAFFIRVDQHDKAGEPSGNRGGLSHARSADSVSRSFTSLLGNTPFSNPQPSRHLTFNAIMRDDDVGHSSTSCSGPKNASDDGEATSFEVIPKRRQDFQLGGERFVFPAKQESFSGSLPGKASNGGTQHPTTDGWNTGVNSRPSMVTSAYPDGEGRVADPEVTLCKENGIDKPSTYQVSPNLGVTDGAVSSAAVVVDVTADILHSSSPPADSHADAALPTTDESSAAAATAVGAETDGAKRENSPLIKSTTSKKSCKFKVRVTPSDLDSANGSKEHSASSSNKPCIHFNGSSHNNVFCFGDYSILNIGFNHTDTESD